MGAQSQEQQATGQDLATSGYRQFDTTRLIMFAVLGAAFCIGAYFYLS
jgi:hypothetical protein